MSSEWAVEIKGLHHHWGGRGGGFDLRVEDWRLARGGRVAFHGPSGSGKSTLLGLIAGLHPLQGGQLMVEGLCLHGASERQRRVHRMASVGLIPQGDPLVSSLNALENVLLPYRLGGGLRLTEAVRARARGLLLSLGLEVQSRQMPSALSQGERQRVAIARALITEPALLLADEPTSGLDPARSLQVVQSLEALVAERGMSLILVTHDPSLLARFEQRLALGGTREGDAR